MEATPATEATDRVLACYERIEDCYTHEDRGARVTVSGVLTKVELFSVSGRDQYALFGEVPNRGRFRCEFEDRSDWRFLDQMVGMTVTLHGEFDRIEGGGILLREERHTISIVLSDCRIPEAAQVLVEDSDGSVQWRSHRRNRSRASCLLRRRSALPLVTVYGIDAWRPEIIGRKRYESAERTVVRFCRALEASSTKQQGRRENQEA